MFDWISGFLDAAGLFGVALLMFLENLFPPIPSELIMPIAGYNAAAHGRSLLAVIVAGSLGSLAGALFWYWVGWRIGEAALKRLARRHGRFMTVTPSEIDSATDWFARYGKWAVLFGRLLPTVRTFISVPAGVARMPLPLFLGFTTVGTVIWTAGLAIAGTLLNGQYELIARWINPVSTGVVVVLVGIYLWRVATFKGSAVQDIDDAG